MRDVLTHHYFGIDDYILWHTVQKDLDLLEETVKSIIQKSGKDFYENEQ